LHLGKVYPHSHNVQVTALNLWAQYARCPFTNMNNVRNVPTAWRDLQLWKLAANILNKQPRTDNKGWSSSLAVGRGVNNPSP
jgi:hypothetical protein